MGQVKREDADHYFHGERPKGKFDQMIERLTTPDMSASDKREALRLYLVEMLNKYPTVILAGKNMNPPISKQKLIPKLKELGIIYRSYWVIQK